MRGVLDIASCESSPSFIFDTRTSKCRHLKRKTNVIIREKKEGLILATRSASADLKGRENERILEIGTLFTNRSGIPAQGSQGLSKVPRAFSRAVKSVVWPRGYHGVTTWTRVSDCNSFEIAFGLPWDCFDFERITSPVSKSGPNSCPSGLSLSLSLSSRSRRTMRNPASKRSRGGKPLIFSLVSLFLPLRFIAVLLSNTNKRWGGGRKKLVGLQEKISKWFDLSRYDWHCFHTRNRPYISRRTRHDPTTR